MRNVRKAARGKGVQPASGLAVPRLRASRIPQKGGIDEKEVEAPRKVRYAHKIGGEMANGREIRAENLLCRQGRRGVFPIHHDRRSQPEAVYLRV